MPTNCERLIYDLDMTMDKLGATDLEIQNGCTSSLKPNHPFLLKQWADKGFLLRRHRDTLRQNNLQTGMIVKLDHMALFGTVGVQTRGNARIHPVFALVRSAANPDKHYLFQALQSHIPILKILDCSYFSSGWFRGMPQNKDRLATLIVLYFLIYQSIHAQGYHTDQFAIIVHIIYHHVCKGPHSHDFQPSAPGARNVVHIP